VIVFDDVIAGGSHLKAMKRVLQERFPAVQIISVVLARTIRPEEPTVNIDISQILRRFGGKS
jgi:hypoxanthine-guanine phosphoribosyltransferase